MSFASHILSSSAFLWLLGPTISCAHDGDLDRTFASFGKERIPLKSAGHLAHFGAALAIQSDRKLVLAGTKYSSDANGKYNYDICLVRINPDGSSDLGFGNQGEVDIALDRGGDGFDSASKVLVQTDGKIIVVGEIEGDATTGLDIVALRLNSDGSVDSTYGVGGKSIIPFNLGTPPHVDDLAAGATLDSHGRLLIAGTSNAGDLTLFSVLTLVRLDPTGVRDTTFSLDGRVTYGSEAAPAEAFSVHELANHKIIVAGATGADNLDMLLVRFNADGKIDTSFGDAGVATYGDEFGGAMNDVLSDFAELGDGSIIAGGYVTINAPANTDFALLKFTADGALFPGFSPRAYPLDYGGLFLDAATSLAIDQGGRILLGGLVSIDVINGEPLLDFGVLRMKADGQLDPTFGDNGVVVQSSVALTGEDVENSGTVMALDADQHVVLVGTSAYSSSDTYQHDFAVLRFMGDTIFADGVGP